MNQKVNKKVPVTLNLTVSLYAVLKKMSRDEGCSKSEMMRSLVRSKGQKKYGLDVDNPNPQELAKIVEWIKDVEQDDETASAKKPKRGRVKGRGSIATA